MKMWSFVVLFICFDASAQTLGGNAIFNFLNQPNSAQLSALGGINVSNISNDVGMTFQTPTLLRNEMHRKINASFNSFVAGIKSFSLTAAYHSVRYNTNVGFGINYFSYGSIPQTDASGNELGTFHPNDYVVQFAASKQYKQNWYYGTTFKFISSQYGQYKSNGLAVDVGITYLDSIKNIQASIVVKNIGTQLKTYDGAAGKEELPFDLQAGVTKRLEKAPLQFSLTAHNLHRFNIYYNDTSFLSSEGVDDFRDKKFIAGKIISHLVLGAQVFVGDKIEVNAGYNFLRRKDLNVYNTVNGLSGFTIGAGLILKNLDVRFTSGFYQQNTFNQFSLNVGL